MGKFDGIVLLSDMDGTLLDDQKQISEENQRAIDRFEREGGCFCIATGRPPMTTVDFEELLPADAPRVYLNGAFVRDGAGKTLASLPLNDEIWTLIDRIAQEFPMVGCELFASEQIYLYRSSPESMRHQQMASCEFTDFAQYRPGEPLYKANFTGQPEILAQVREACADLLAQYEAASSTSIFLEVTEKRASKGEALRTIKQELNAKRAYAIGDSGNDLSMLLAADFSFAPENADADILEIVSQVVRRNTQHAIAHAIEVIEQQL